MDTELKRFNRLIIRKTVAVIFCIICMVTMALQICSDLVLAEKMDLSWDNCRDAIEHRILGAEENVWFYGSFISEYVRFSNLIGNSIEKFGDGSEKTYKEMKKAEEKKYGDNIEKTRQNLIKAAGSRKSYFLAAVISGDIDIVDRFIFTADGSREYQEESLWGLEDFLDYESLMNDTFIYDEGNVPADIKKAFKGTDYDAVYFNSSDIEIYDHENGTLCGEYAAGYYAFKVDDDILKSNILNLREFEDYYPDYSSFYAVYADTQKQIETDYASVRYFIRDGKGKVYTNISFLGTKADKEKIEKVFSEYGTYSHSVDGNTYLNDGRFYSDTFFDFYTRFSSSEVYTTQVYKTTTLPSAIETTMIDNGDVTYVSEVVTVPVVPTTSFSGTHSYSQSENVRYYEAYIAIDENSDSETCKFTGIGGKVLYAERIIKNCVAVCGIMALIFVICFLYLVAKAGRVQGSDKIHLIKGDKIFTEIRIFLDGSVIAGALFLMYLVLSLLFNSSQTYTMYTLIGILTIAVTVAFLDLVLYLTRHIKNRSLLSNISIIWVLKKLFSCGKKVYSSVKKRSDGIKDRLLYTKELEKTVIIRTLITIGINIISAGLGIVLVADDEPSGVTVIGLLFLFDLYILYRGIKFTGGVNKLFSVVKEMRDGKLDVEINYNALPGYLYLPAENLQCLSEGIRTAVEEAVKQEKTKTELITNVSHDLKTPLTSIINYVDLLKKCDISDETALSYLQVLSEKSDRLKVLIEDLVEASKASAGALTVEFVCVNCRELISQLVGEFEDSFEEKGLSVIVKLPEEDVNLNADSKHIYRVMENLFVNVRKYALESTRVYITVSSQGDKGIINIKNISAAPLDISADQLKERFVRGEQSRTTEGNGLGLSIAENLCLLQKGSLGIEISGDLFSVTVELEKYKSN